MIVAAPGDDGLRTAFYSSFKKRKVSVCGFCLMMAVAKSLEVKSIKKQRERVHTSLPSPLFISIAVIITVLFNPSRDPILIILLGGIIYWLFILYVLSEKK
jgi:chromate transport protein ChrA